MVLVANKADLEGERVVAGPEGEVLASELKVGRERERGGEEGEI